MPVDIFLPDIPPEDALGHLRSWLQRHVARHRERNESGRFTFSLNAVIDELLEREQARHRSENPTGMIMYRRDPFPNSESFQDAAWELCARGVLRPSVVRPEREGPRWTGVDLAVTEYGEQWLSEVTGADIAPSEGGRFSGLLSSFDKTFGDGYRSRSQEALRCYQAHAYLATCVMCGAAAEAILLRTEIERRGSAEEVHQAYRGANGRSRVENILIGGASSYLRENLQQFTALLKYWRDDASHGHATRLGEQEAFLALLMLVRFASFVHERWEELVRSANPR